MWDISLGLVALANFCCISEVVLIPLRTLKSDSVSHPNEIETNDHGLAKISFPTTIWQGDSEAVSTDDLPDERSFSADRSNKRSTLVVAIVADGIGLKPLMIVPCLTIERRVRFIAISRVEEWVNKVRMPYYAEQEELMNVTGWGLLRMAGCTCHSLTSLESKLREHRICLIVLPAHSSDQMQPLDGGVIAAVKRDSMNSINARTVSTQRSQIIRMFDALIRETVRRTIVNAYRQGSRLLSDEEGGWCISVSIRRPPRKFDPGQTDGISPKEWDAHAKGEFGWLRNRVQILTSQYPLGY
jgi:hypothetical protein